MMGTEARPARPRIDSGATRVLDAVAVGAGPANLSLAALAEPVGELDLLVLDREPRFSWHPGIMLPEATLQTTPLKDLVAPVDPTNRLSFLNFLVQQGRMYRYLIAARAAVTRSEFFQYYAWAAEQLDCVRFDTDVTGIRLAGGRFVLETSRGPLQARNVVLGVGHEPWVPPFAEPLLGAHVMHAATYLDHDRAQLAGRDVMVVGGGQSGAEVVLDLLTLPGGHPRRLVWVSGRTGFLPYDDSPFSNEWFNPRYTQYVHGLDAHRRRELASEQLLASDGVSEQLLLDIYRRIYHLDYVEPDAFGHALLAGYRLTDLHATGSGFEAVLGTRDHHAEVRERVDRVILATGYRSRLPALLRSLGTDVTLDGDEPLLDDSYRLQWSGPRHRDIYVQGMTRASHGVADVNLSIGAWRSALIVNRLCGRAVYPVERSDITLALRPTPSSANGNGPAKGDSRHVE